MPITLGMFSSRITETAASTRVGFTPPALDRGVDLLGTSATLV